MKKKYFIIILAAVLIVGCGEKFRQTAHEALNVQQSIKDSNIVALYDRANRANLALSKVKIKSATTDAERDIILNNLAESFHKNAVTMQQVERANRAGDIADIYIMTREGWLTMAWRKWKESSTTQPVSVDNTTK